MRRTELGSTGMELSRIGFGAWAVGGGGYQFGWGDQSDRDSIAAIHRALELGVNWIDTAAVYGLGRSERVVASALQGIEPRPYVFTKASRVVDADGKIVGNLQRASIRRELEASLERLGVDAIDLYQIHWPIPEEDIEEGWTTLADLKAEGRIRHIGVSNFTVGQLERIRAIAPVETVQPPYSLIAREIEDTTLPYCRKHRIGVIAYSPMASGLLTGSMSAARVEQFPSDDWRSRDARFREPQLGGNLELAARLGEIGQRHGASAGAVAVAWVIRQPGICGAIVGFRHPDQVDEIVGAASIELDAAEVAEMENGQAFGELHE